jgi:hypothetical protein
VTGLTFPTMGLLGKIPQEVYALNFCFSGETVIGKPHIYVKNTFLKVTNENILIFQGSVTACRVNPHYQNNPPKH